MGKTPLKLKSRSNDNTKETLAPESKWRILIVDDDQEVHKVTKMILGNVRYRNQGVELLHAHSAAEAERTLKQEKNIALILLDVVMETDDAGLRLVEIIRSDLNNKAVRIVLRTGQPGQAPEEKVIVDYDINDYKAKTELTAQKLFTTTIAALRSYADIIALEANRAGLQKILDSSDQLVKLNSMRTFASGVLTQISAFLGCKPNGILCIALPEVEGEPAAPYIPAGSGDYADCQDCQLDKICQYEDITVMVKKAIDTHHNIFDDNYTVLYMDAGDACGSVAVLHTDHRPSSNDEQLLAVFASKISIGFQNVLLYEQMENKVAERTKELEEANQKLEFLATTAELTGCHNRRSFLARMEEELERSLRYNHDLTLCILDLDHFKQTNDRYGHAIGDEVLIKLAEVAKDILRPTDMFGRLGGEEFGIMLPETPLDEGKAAAARLIAAIEELSFSIPELKITASIGATPHRKEDTLDILTARADQALYKAKQNGRNRVEVLEA